MSASDNDFVETSCYAQVEPIWRYSDRTLAKSLRGASVVRLTQSHPRQPIGGTVLVKLSLRLPRDAFLPLQPAMLVVPPGYAHATLLEEVAE